jgi:hypothetical protein
VKPPIFIFGVPRSGTTLLRTILNCHPHIACGPEAPWLAHQSGGVTGLYRTLTEGEFSFSRNFGVPPEQVRARVRELVDHLFSDFARQQGKQRWAHKTPDDCLFVDFFAELFPDAKYVHIVRHPLDVALSTARIAAHRKGVSEWHEKNLVIEENTAIPNTLFNAVLRWRRWNDKIRRGLAARDHLQVRYEDLVSQPLPAFQSLFRHLDEPFDPAILDYGQFPSIFPGWEWGSADVKRAGAINTGSVARWKKELGATEAAALLSLAAPLASSVPASPPPFDSEAGRIFLDGLDDLAASLSLPARLSATAGWIPGWWWLAGLSEIDWAKIRLLTIGDTLSPFPCFLSLLGSRLTLSDSDPAAASRWKELRHQLNVNVDGPVIPDLSGALPLEAGSIDVALLPDFSLLPSPEQDRRLAEIARVLRPSGLLALSFRQNPADPARDPLEQLRHRFGFSLVSQVRETPTSAGGNTAGFVRGAALLSKVA